MSKIDKLSEIYEDLEHILDEMYKNGVWRAAYAHIGLAMESLHEQLQELLIEERK